MSMVPITSNAPLRGGKANIYEGGSREPLIVAWSGHIEAGSRNDQAIVQSIDFFPTLTELCGLDMPDPVDGISFAPALRGESLARAEHHFLPLSALYAGSRWPTIDLCPQRRLETHPILLRQRRPERPRRTLQLG